MRLQVNLERTKVRATRGHTGHQMGLAEVRTLIESADLGMTPEDLVRSGRDPHAFCPTCMVNMTKFDALLSISVCGLSADILDDRPKSEIFLYATTRGVTGTGAIKLLPVVQWLKEWVNDDGNIARELGT